MCNMKLPLVPLLILFASSPVISVEDQITALLWNLTSFAVESRQNFYRPPNPYTPSPNVYQKPHQPFQESLGVLAHPDIPPNLYQNPPLQGPAQESLPPNLYQKPYSPFQRPAQESLMDVLHTIAINDKLQCVPRLVCEVTSEVISSRQINLPNLPFNINMESLIGLLSLVNIDGNLPIPFFAKAAILGYNSKGSLRSCTDSYPRCPKDPGKLIQYLNNYNGGFFRYFNGVNNNRYESRIQNKPVFYVPTSNYYPTNERKEKSFKFPTNYYLSSNYESPTQTLIFPDDDEKQNPNYNPYNDKKAKKLVFPPIHYDYNDNDYDFQRPLPNHHASPMIFPDRTGTGDLRLDLD